MKTLFTFDGNSTEVIELTREQFNKIGTLNENVYTIKVDKIKINGFDLVIIEAEGDEPFGDILAELQHVGYDISSQGRPHDTGYDINADGIGINSTYAIVRK